MPPTEQEILFTRQRHEADRAGLHYDIRFVVGDLAYSFATKKDIPEIGKAILLHEQPVHTASYALSQHVVIPKGQYGAGTTTLDFVRKAKVKPGKAQDSMTIHTGDGRFLLKKLDEKYGEKAWLFKNLGMEKTATERTYGDVTYPRAKYRDHTQESNADIESPVGMKKYDGASFFAVVGQDGGLRYFSRRPSVHGGFPERTAALPHLSDVKVPELAGSVYNVELIHTGHSHGSEESHSAVSGILNSLPARAIETQRRTGPVRVVIHNVVYPSLPTFKDKLAYTHALQSAFGKPELLRAVEVHAGNEAIARLLERTKKEGSEGIIVTSLTAPEESNPRLRVKHLSYHNLNVVGFEEELDKSGKPKGSLGSLVVADSTGKVVARVGTGFTKAMRKQVWASRPDWLGKPVQVKSFGVARHRLRGPVYNGDADGDVDRV